MWPKSCQVPETFQPIWVWLKWSFEALAKGYHPTADPWGEPLKKGVMEDMQGQPPHPKHYRCFVWSILGDQEFFSNTLDLPHWASHFPCHQCDCQNFDDADDGKHVKEIRVDHQKFILVSHKEALKKVQDALEKAGKTLKKGALEKAEGPLKKGALEKAEKPLKKGALEKAEKPLKKGIHPIFTLPGVSTQMVKGTKLHQAAAKLTKNEFKQLQEILQVVKQREAADAAEVEKGTLPLMDIAEKKRSLKKGNSNTSHVSMDASGFPRMFASPSSSSKPLKKASSPLGKGEDPLKKPLKKGKTFPNKPLKKPLTSPKKPLKKGKTSPNKSLKKGNTSPNKSLKKETTSPKKPLGKGLARNSRMRRESLQKAGGSLEKGPKESLTSDLGYKSGSGLKRPAGQALKKATKSLKKEPAGAMTKWFKIKKNCGKQAQAKGLFDRLLGGGWQIPFDCRSDTSKVTPLPQGD